MNLRSRMFLCTMSMLSCLLIGSSILKAQAVGEITGMVADPSGAVVPDARITATRDATGVSKSTVSSTAGTYTIPNLMVGTYTVTAEASGFKTGVAHNITLDVSQQREVNFTLALAGVQSTVEVSAAPPLLNTTDSQLGTVVTGEQVQNLPLNGRNVENLIAIQAGVQWYGGSMGWMSGELASNGNRGETMVGTLDGADISDPEMGTLQFTDFNLDAIAEFKYLQNNYSAQYGQGAGSITQIVSKTGTNQFHGSLFEFVRNSAFDARNFFSATVPPLKRNEFGGTFGGPVKKDKTFFFVQYAGLRQRSGYPNIVPVPTTAERAGEVTIIGANGQPDQLQVTLNPVAQDVLSRYPLPNEPNGPLGANTFNYMFSQPTNNDQFSARLDHTFSTKDNLFVRASYVNDIARETDSWAAEMGGANFSTSNIGEGRNYAIGETHLFRPTLLNDFRFTLNRGIEGVPEAPAEVNTTDTSFSDGSLQWWGPDSFETKYNVTMIDPKDDLTWTTGRHTFKFGAEFRRERDNGTGVTGIGPSGSYSFNPGVPLTETIQSTNGGAPLLAGSPSPNSLISMMEGDDYNYGRATAVPGYGPPGGGFVWWGLRRWTLGVYAQDDFKVTHTLTLNLGLRYEYQSVPWEVGNRLAGPADYGSLYGQFVMNPKPMWQPDYLSGNFGPRVGLAQRLGKNTVLRGGFAIFTNMIPTVYPDQALVNFPIASLNYLPNAPYSINPLSVSLPVLTSTSGQPIAADWNTKRVPPNTPVNLVPYANILGPIGGDWASDRLRNGYTINGNFTLEHQFRGDIQAQISYVANNGVSLYDQAWPNAYTGAEPQYTPYSDISPGLSPGFQMFYNGGYSSYNALQIQARKVSAAHGITFSANYTWAKDMTDADSVWNVGATSQNNPQCLKCEYAPANYSIPQTFNASFEYQLPISHWQALSSLPRRLTEGWKFLGIPGAGTGGPFSVSGPYGNLQYGEGGPQRPFFIKRATLAPGAYSGGTQFFSNDVIGNNNGIGTGFFGLPLVTSPVNQDQVLPSPGNLGRNTFTSPGWWGLDCSVVKDTKISESKVVQFRAEFFSVFNNVSMWGPNSGLGSPGFGMITGAGGNRVIQLALRVMF